MRPQGRTGLHDTGGYLGDVENAAVVDYTRVCGS